MDRLNVATVDLITHSVDVGVVNLLLPPSPDYPVCFRAQQSSREAEGKECVSIRGRGHLEATGLEQQSQTHPGL